MSIATTQTSELKSKLREMAYAQGFDAVAFATPGSITEAAKGLGEFLAAGRQGDMGWLAANAERRGDPSVLWPAAKSVIVLALNYGPARDPLEVLERRGLGAVSVYAEGGDYHDVIKHKLKSIGRWLAERTGSAVKVFADTAPVMEKPLAQAAGIGWQGKHTNLVSREFGSWLFLGSIFSEVVFEADQAERDHCGACRRCLEVCPTAAFPRAYEIDARRCISYLTIEHKGHIAREFRAAMGNRIFGCDDCLAVCPWNKFARLGREARLTARADAIAPLGELLGLDDEAFRTRFRGTPIKRTGRDRFVRNVLIAAGNSGDRDLLGAIERLLSDVAPLVRAMAVWACARLMPAGDFACAQTRYLPLEKDADVKREWREAQE